HPAPGRQIDEELPQPVAAGRAEQVEILARAPLDPGLPGRHLRVEARRNTRRIGNHVRQPARPPSFHEAHADAKEGRAALQLRGGPPEARIWGAERANAGAKRPPVGVEDARIANHTTQEAEDASRRPGAERRTRCGARAACSGAPR